MTIKSPKFKCAKVEANRGRPEPCREQCPSCVIWFGGIDGKKAESGLQGSSQSPGAIAAGKETDGPEVRSTT